MLSSWLILRCSYPESRDQNTLYSCLIHIFVLIYILCLEHGVNIRDSFGGTMAAVFSLLATKSVRVVYNVPAVRKTYVSIPSGPYSKLLCPSISTVDHPTRVNTMIRQSPKSKETTIQPEDVTRAIVNQLFSAGVAVRYSILPCPVSGGLRDFSSMAAKEDK